MTRLLPAMAGRTLLWFRTHVPWLTVSNGLIAAAPGTTLMAEAFDEADRRLDAAEDRGDVLWLVGPIMLRSVTARLGAERRLDPVERMTTRFVNDRLISTVRAGYRDDSRNWRIWRKEGGA